MQIVLIKYYISSHLYAFTILYQPLILRGVAYKDTSVGSGGEFTMALGLVVQNIRSVSKYAQLAIIRYLTVIQLVGSFSSRK